MKTLLEHKQAKAVRRAKREGSQVYFWSHNMLHGYPVGDRYWHLYALPGGEIIRYYGEYFDGTTLHEEYWIQVYTPSS